MATRRVLDIQGVPDRSRGSVLLVNPIGKHRSAVELFNRQIPEGRKVVVRVSKWYEPRTTGKRSQNHRINGFIQQILVALALDYTVEEFKYFLKMQAISRGYPFKTMPDGSVFPISESEADTLDAGFLIDEIEQWAAEHTVRLLQYDDAGGIIRI